MLINNFYISSILILFMLDLIIKHSIAGLYLIAGSISDIKTREVADWANYGLIALGVFTNLIFSIFYNNWNYSLTSLIGFGVFLALSLFMFYTGQWGGGDAKMLMGLGALYGLGFNWDDSTFLVAFIVNTLIAGAVYGILWSIFISFRNRKKFMQQYIKLSSSKSMKTLKIVSIIILAVALIFSIFDTIPIIRFSPIIIACLAVLTLYLWIVIKAVENSCMYKLVTPDKLTEGDWIAKDVKFKGKYITGPKDLGISKKQIIALKKLYRQKKIKNILIKEGIPFVPSFFLGWIMTLAIGNILNFLL